MRNVAVFLVVVSLFAFARAGYAAGAKTSERELQNNETENYLHLLDQSNTLIQYLNSEKEFNCIECTAAAAGTRNSTLDTSPALKICKDKWTEFYKRDVVDLRITFGYMDESFQTVASDYLQRQALIDQISTSCERDGGLVRACGFKRSEDDQDVFEKQQMGPDGKMHLMRLRLTASAQSASDRLNRGLRAEQEKASAKAEKYFYGGLCEAEFSMYIGHARDGGGPDFKPAKLKSNGAINYDFYRTERPGINRVNDTLRNCPEGKTSQILAFLACDSSRWDKSISTSAPKSGLMLSSTPLINSNVPIAQAFFALDSILAQRCNIPTGTEQDGAFDRAMRQVPKYDGQTIIPVKLKNFFK